MADSKEKSNGLKQDYKTKDNVRKHDVKGCVVVDRKTRVDVDEVDLGRARKVYEEKLGIHLTGNKKKMVEIQSEFILPDSIEGIREGVKNGLWTEDDIIFSTQRGYRLFLGDKIKAKVVKSQLKGGKSMELLMMSDSERGKLILAAKKLNPKATKEELVKIVLKTM